MAEQNHENEDAESAIELEHAAEKLPSANPFNSFLRLSPQLSVLGSLLQSFMGTMLHVSFSTLTAPHWQYQSSGQAYSGC